MLYLFQQCCNYNNGQQFSEPIQWISILTVLFEYFKWVVVLLEQITALMYVMNTAWAQPNRTALSHL